MGRLDWGVRLYFYWMEGPWAEERDVFLFSVNEFVLYNTTGICQIKEIREREFEGFGAKTYYVLKPVYNQLSEIFVPVDNEVLTGKMRGIMSLDEVYSLIDSLEGDRDAWIPDNRLRSKAFEQILKNGSSRELVEMLKTIFSFRKERIAAGKQLQQADQHALDKAEKLLFQEFAIILGIAPEEVPSFISNRLGAAGVPSLGGGA